MKDEYVYLVFQSKNEKMLVKNNGTIVECLIEVWTINECKIQKHF